MASTWLRVFAPDGTRSQDLDADRVTTKGGVVSFFLQGKLVAQLDEASIKRIEEPGTRTVVQPEAV